MKRYINLLSLVILFSSMLLISCEKEAMTYEGKDTIYFDIRTGGWIGGFLDKYERMFYNVQ